MPESFDIAIVGAGAAGLATAIFAGENARQRRDKMRIVLLDGANTIGAKILVSGGGRCNVTHDRIQIGDYNGSKNIVRNVLAAFDEEATVRWFSSMGVELKREETGKLFPVSDSAKTVLAALLRRCSEVGVEVRAGWRVRDVERKADGFVIRGDAGEIEASRLVLATGGRSLPRTGSDGAGWGMAQKLGHTVSETYPALVPLVLDEKFFHAAISGLSHGAELVTLVEGKTADRRTGSLLWTHFGISGPVVMDASRHWVIAHAQGKPVEMRCAILPGVTFEQAEGWIIDAARQRPRLSALRLLNEKLPERLAVALLGHVGVEQATALSQLSREDRRKLVHALTALPLPVVRDRGWNYAEVTAGGIPLGEVNYRTMESRIVPGLYLVGEILDCDGRIGGFNFQWAWSTGFVAGCAAGVPTGGPPLRG